MVFDNAVFIKPDVEFVREMTIDQGVKAYYKGVLLDGGQTFNSYQINAKTQEILNIFSTARGNL